MRTGRAITTIYLNPRSRYQRTWGVIGILLLSALLSDQFQAHNVLNSRDLRMWQFFVAVLGFLLLCGGRLTLPRPFLTATLLVVAHTFLVTLISGVFEWFMALQIFLVGGCFVVLYSALKALPVSRLPELYLLGATLVAWSIIFEQVLHVVAPALAESTLYTVINKQDGPFGLVRAHGLMMEPSQVALVLPPAIYICLVQQRVRLTLFLVFGSYLTFSGLTLIGLMAATLVYVLMTRGFRWQMVAVGVVVAALAMAAPPVRERVVATGKATALITSQQSFDERLYFESLRGSVGSLAVATLISASAFTRNYTLGTGIGLLGTEGERWLEDVSTSDTDSLRENTTLFAKVDTGGSLLLRLIGEFGLLGIVVIVVGLRRWVRSLARLRHACRVDRGWRTDWRVQVLGLVLVLIVPYVVRKDGYLNIYLLLPLAAGVLAAQQFKATRRRVHPQPGQVRSITDRKSVV